MPRAICEKHESTIFYWRISMTITPSASLTQLIGQALTKEFKQSCKDPERYKEVNEVVIRHLSSGVVSLNDAEGNSCMIHRLTREQVDRLAVLTDENPTPSPELCRSIVATMIGMEAHVQVGCPINKAMKLFLLAHHTPLKEANNEVRQIMQKFDILDLIDEQEPEQLTLFIKDQEPEAAAQKIYDFICTVQTHLISPRIVKYDQLCEKLINSIRRTANDSNTTKQVESELLSEDRLFRNFIEDSNETLLEIFKETFPSVWNTES